MYHIPSHIRPCKGRSWGWTGMSQYADSMSTLASNAPLPYDEATLASCFKHLGILPALTGDAASLISGCNNEVNPTRFKFDYGP